MFNTGTGMSPADIAAISNDGINGGGGWWLILFIILICGGWGAGGGNWNYGNPGVMDNYVISSDFSQLMNRVNQIGDYLGNGIADATFSLNNSINGVDKAIMGARADITSAVNYDTYQSAQNTSAIQASMANYANGIERGIDAVNNNITATNCATQRAISDATAAIKANCDANYRSLHDEIVANRFEDKNAQIAALQAQVNQLTLTNSQAEQTNYLINRLQPTPIPSFQVASPYYCGCNNNCGCPAFN